MLIDVTLLLHVFSKLFVEVSSFGSEPVFVSLGLILAKFHRHF